MAHSGFNKFIRKTALAPFIFALMLAGCSEDFSLGDDPLDESIVIEDGAAQTIETDIVETGAFSIQDTAIWDGRPTFGGIWIAHPDAETPERVRIRNEETGKEVIPTGNNGAITMGTPDNADPYLGEL